MRVNDHEEIYGKMGLGEFRRSPGKIDPSRVMKRTGGSMSEGGTPYNDPRDRALKTNVYKEGGPAFEGKDPSETAHKKGGKIFASPLPGSKAGSQGRSCHAEGGTPGDSMSATGREEKWIGGPMGSFSNMQELINHQKQSMAPGIEKWENQRLMPRPQRPQRDEMAIHGESNIKPGLYGMGTPKMPPNPMQATTTMGMPAKYGPNAG